MFDVTLLWRAPEVNPINKKARSIPILNPIDPYGRVFFFSWLGFMLAFWAWYVPSTSIEASSIRMTIASCSVQRLTG